MGRQKRRAGGGGMSAGPKRRVPMTVTFFEMLAKPSALPPPAPKGRHAILKAEMPTTHFYRYLYDTIGEPYFWVERRLWSHEKLKAHLADPKIVLYTLYLAGVPGGMVELDFREKGLCQIGYFGLMPEFTGRRIGPWFLHQVVELAWAEPVTRVILNTCTLDHKKALVTYQRAGFVAYARSERVVLVPPDFPGR
jgi:GNAT superfamily N-acetyltransferase